MVRIAPVTGLIGMKDHLPFAFTPDESYGANRAGSFRVGFIANGAVEAHAHPVHLRSHQAHDRLLPEQRHHAKAGC